MNDCSKNSSSKGQKKNKNPQKGHNSLGRILISVLTGAGVGAVNGFFGGGGGMLVVPLLEKGLKKETKTAHATAILIILPICICSAVMYIVKGHFSLYQGGIAGAGVVVGGVIGALLLKKLPATTVRIIFDVLMVAAGIKMLL